MTLTFIALTVAAALQLVLWQKLAPSVLVGDEKEYALPPAQRPTAAYVRVPLHRALLRVVLRIWPARGFASVRWFVAVQSLATIGLCVLYAETHLGTLPALLAAVLLLSNLERAILALHLWPDIAMGLAWLAMALLLVPSEAGAFLPLALVGGIALGLRIEGAALCAVAVLYPLAKAGTGPAALNAATCAGFTVAYMAWNRAQTGRWVLDSTFSFNVKVLHIDAAGTASISETMRNALQQGPGKPRRTTARMHLFRLLARVRALLGPETFVSQALMQTGNPGYTGPWRPTRPAMALVLRHSFTACTFLTLLLAPVALTAHVALLGLATLIYLLLLVRSRHRMALLPMMALICAEGAANFLAAPRVWPLGPGLVAVAFLALILVLAPKTDEIPQGSPARDR